MSPENTDYAQTSFLDKKDIPVETPKKKFISVGGKKLAYTMTQEHPGAWIKEESLIYIQPREEMTSPQLVGISVHEAAYLWLLMAQHPLTAGVDPYLHAQEVTAQYLPIMFPSANKADFARREMLLTQYLPELWPDKEQDLDIDSLKQIFESVHRKTLYPHLSDQERLDDISLQDTSTGPYRLRNFVRFTEENLLPKIGEDSYVLCEQTIIQHFREKLNVRITSKADILIVTQGTLMKGVPFFVYDLIDIKSGKRPNPEAKEYLQHLYQLWIMKRGLERISLSQIEDAISQKKAILTNNSDEPLENLVINCYLVWPYLRPFSEHLCELVSLPDEKETKEKLYQALNLYRQFSDGELGKGLSSDRDILLRKKR